MTMKSKLERIKNLREIGKSLHEAKRIVERQDIDQEIMNAKTVEDLKAILWTLNNR